MQLGEEEGVQVGVGARVLQNLMVGLSKYMGKAHGRPLRLR